ncbi:MAG: hypothetical protein LBO74_08610 [Candidatus Symbiothrix sp.]|jgi:hypothetical protein|nr:hypothetical protein [Candidatus Symbiothrix sp.]
MEKKEQKKLFWDTRIVITFKKNRLKLNILAYDESKEQAENKGREWAKKYVEDNSESISKHIGYDAFMTEKPRVQAFKTSYATVI